MSLLVGTMRSEVGREAPRVDRQGEEHALDDRRRAVLACLCNLVFPDDELGPGATALGALDFIDRKLRSWAGEDVVRFASALDEIDDLAVRNWGRSVDGILPEQQEALFEQLTLGGGVPDMPECWWAAEWIIELTVQGCFSDPTYGGNRAGMGWAMMRYPRPPAADGAH